jgi:hypothetical protein
MGWKISELANKAIHMNTIENLRSKNVFTAKYQTMQHASSQPYLNVKAAHTNQSLFKYSEEDVNDIT